MIGFKRCFWPFFIKCALQSGIILKIMKRRLSFSIQIIFYQFCLFLYFYTFRLFQMICLMNLFIKNFRRHMKVKFNIFRLWKACPVEYWLTAWRINKSFSKIKRWNRYLNQLNKLLRISKFRLTFNHLKLFNQLIQYL